MAYVLQSGNRSRAPRAGAALAASLRRSSGRSSHSYRRGSREDWPSRMAQCMRTQMLYASRSRVFHLPLKDRQDLFDITSERVPIEWRTQGDSYPRGTGVEVL